MTDKIIELCRRMYKSGWEASENYEDSDVIMPSEETIKGIIKENGIDTDIQTYYKVKDSIT